MMGFTIDSDYILRVETGVYHYYLSIVSKKDWYYFSNPPMPKYHLEAILLKDYKNNDYYIKKARRIIKTKIFQRHMLALRMK